MGRGSPTGRRSGPICAKYGRSYSTQLTVHGAGGIRIAIVAVPFDPSVLTRIACVTREETNPCWFSRAIEVVSATR
jgi:hypothetical protein